VKIPLEGGKSVGESETPVLEELNPPKNSNIPWRNQGNAMGSLGMPSRLNLRREW
jgi:hypothetical protein